MPELLEEPVVEVNEQTVQVPDTAESSDPVPVDETPAEPVVECSSEEAPLLADEPIEMPVIEEPIAALAEPIEVAADQCSVEESAEVPVVADQVTESHD